MGLFGTSASLLTDVGLFLVQLSAFLAFIGHRFIKKMRHPSWHHFTMISSYAMLWGFLTLYVSNYLLNDVSYFGGPSEIALLYYPFLLLHIIGAATMGLLTTYFIISGIKRTKYPETGWNKFNFEPTYQNRHKTLGKLVFWLWYATAVSGLIVYIMLYVIFEPKKTIILS